MAAKKKVAGQKSTDLPFSDWSKQFDARPDRLDLRDRPYIPPLRSLPPQFPTDAQIAKLLPAYISSGLILDQGQEGACTGFGLACVANYLFFRRKLELAPRARASIESVSPRMLYELARTYDEWPGEDYSGSSCRGAVKGWHKHGVCTESTWPYGLRGSKVVFQSPAKGWEADAATRPLGVYYRVDRASIVDLQAAIHEIGAIFVSASVHSGWNELSTPSVVSPRSHKSLPVIQPKKPGDRLGGHAFALVGYNANGFIVQNSWGPNWGAGGFAVLPYSDWIVHASDAWACALGAPMAGSETGGAAASSYPVRSGANLANWSLFGRAKANKQDDGNPYPIWGEVEAKNHTLISGNDGFLVRDAIAEARSKDAYEYVRARVVEKPQAWFADKPGIPAKLVIYAHGGLNDEDASIDRIRAMAPVMAANDLYPLFLTWKTGPGETLGSMYEDWKRHLLGDDEPRSEGFFEDLFESARERLDRSFEEVARRLGRSVWSEMRENAARGTRKDRVLDLLARGLLDLRDQLAVQGRPLEVHVIGHSAGSILLGHLLDTFVRNPLLSARKPSIASVTLYAAACSVRFACDTYLKAVQEGVFDLKQLRSYVLSDENERGDALPNRKFPLYGRSLLYLVSRALDEERNMPLLGLERAMTAEYVRRTEKASTYWAEDELETLETWYKAFIGTPAKEDEWRKEFVLSDRSIVIERTHIDDGKVRTKTEKPSHGGYDNDLDVIEKTLATIRGRPLEPPIRSLKF